MTVTLQVVGVQAADEEKRQMVGWGEVGGGGLRMRRQIAETSVDTRKTERKMIVLQDATYKVLSLGMWLKLATDSRLMLLLLRVLGSGGQRIEH